MYSVRAWRAPPPDECGRERSERRERRRADEHEEKGVDPYKAKQHGGAAGRGAVERKRGGEQRDLP